VDSTMLGNETVLAAEVLPFVDGVTATTSVTPAPPADAPIFTFSASQDPGEKFQMPRNRKDSLHGVLSNAAQSRSSPSAAAQAVGCLAASAEVLCHEAPA